MFLSELKLFSYDEIDSTNNEAQRLLESIESFPFWVVANKQTSGRGRKNRYWESLEGNFMGTFVIKINIEKSLTPQISFVTSVALRNTVNSFNKKINNNDIKLKWPNDLIINDAKCAGILIESLRSEEKGNEILAIGIGVNLINSPSNTSFKASNLLQEMKLNINKDDFLEKLNKNLIENLNLWEKGKNFKKILKEWRKVAYKMNENISIILPDGKKIKGTFTGLDDQGGLILSQNSKETVFYAAEIYDRLIS